MKIPVSEIYPAVQAEGKHKTPAVFVRVWGCNLRCGFTKRKDGKSQCDTPYAVFEGSKTLHTVSEVVNIIKVYPFKHVVFTGGEPLLYMNKIIEIIKQLPEYFIEIETNGTIKPSLFLHRRVNQFNVSVKLKSSKQWAGYDDKRINRDAIKSFNKENAILKFVVSGSRKSELKEIKLIHRLNKELEVYLMPEGENRKQVLNNIPATLDLCLENNYGFTNRDHILAHNTMRGV